jgi:hypothetical protein
MGHDLRVAEVLARLHRIVRLPVVCVGVVTLVNLWILRPEIRGVSTRSDLTVHRTMIDWAVGRLEAGESPIDGWFPRIGLGFPMMHHYQSMPHLLTSLLAWVIGVGNATRWTTFVLVGTWPVAVYIGSRLLRLSVGTAIVAAALAPMVASYSSYGFEHSSYVWRGLGLWAQQWAMWMFPIAMGFAWRAITERRSFAAAAATTAFVMCAHLQTGYLLAMVIGAMAVVSGRDLWLRAVRTGRDLKPRPSRRAYRHRVVRVAGARELVVGARLHRSAVEREHRVQREHGVGGFVRRVAGDALDVRR